MRFSLHYSAALRLALLAAATLLFAAAAAAPLLAANSFPRAAGLIYMLFSPVCHQLPDRSFAHRGYSWAVCHRCSGIYFGLFIGMLVPMRLHLYAAALKRRRAWVCLACTPLMVDVSLAWLRLCQGRPLIRFGTGLLFGIMLASLVICSIAENSAAHAVHPGTRCGSTPTRRN